MLAEWFGQAFATGQYEGTLRPGDVINKLIVNSGMIFGELIMAYSEETRWRLPSSHMAKNTCVRKAKKMFYTTGKIKYCERCLVPRCPVNTAMTQEMIKTYKIQTPFLQKCPSSRTS